MCVRSYRRGIVGSRKDEETDLGALLTLEVSDGNGDIDDPFAAQYRDHSSSRSAAPRQSSTWVSDLSWRYALHALQSLGPAFVKLGQWAATRRDLFPRDACDRLSKLHDSARVHDFDHTHRAVAEAFGDDYEWRGLSFAKKEDGAEDDGIILGSGSAAQVHRGTLTMPATREGDVGGANESNDDNNTTMTTRTVAIKVLHPDTRRLVERDLALMQHAADLVDT